MQKMVKLTSQMTEPFNGGCVRVNTYNEEVVETEEEGKLREPLFACELKGQHSDEEGGDVLEQIGEVP